MPDIPVFRAGEPVVYMTHAAVVAQGNAPQSGWTQEPGKTVNIRLTPPVRGMSAQLDVFASSLRAPSESERKSQRDARARELNRKSKTVLISLYLSGVRAPDGRTVRTLNTRSELARWTKEEILSSILGIEFPGVPA